MALACFSAGTAAACRGETSITGGGSFTAHCSQSGADGQAIGSSNSSFGSIQAELFTGQEAFGSLVDENDTEICFADDQDAADGLPGDFSQQGSFCAGAVLVRVDVD